MSEAQEFAKKGREIFSEEIERLGPKKLNFGLQGIIQTGEWLRPGRYTFEVTYAGDAEERHAASVSFTEHECEILNRLHAQATGKPF